MSQVLCATRGGEESIMAQDLAIQIAKERQLPLAFLFVSDTSFLNQLAAEMIVDVNSELSDLGAFFLHLAIQRAHESGVEAKAIVRPGQFPETLVHVAKELQAEVIVLGHPSGDTGQFDQTAFQAFLEKLQKETGMEVRAPA
jgi:nucleotide-binding universal stress UspA family protein